MSYEYKMVTIETSKSFLGQGHVDEDEILTMIRDMAKKDWELVSAVPIAKVTLFRQTGVTDRIIFFFKRPKTSKTKE